LDDGTDPTYTSSGHLVYGWDNQLLAAAFDTRSLTLTSVPVSTVQQMRMSDGRSLAADYDVSDTGTLVYVAGDASRRRIVWMDATGTMTDLPFPAAAYSEPTLAPDGSRIAVTLAQGASRDLWVGDVERGTLSRVSADGDAVYSLWSPDSKEVFLTSSAGGQYNVFSIRADGSEGMKRVTRSVNPQRPTSISMDGRRLLFNEQDPSSGLDIWVTPIGGDGKPAPLIKTAANEGSGIFSPDGRWVAYESDESGRFELYVQPFPGPGEKRQVSIDGARGFAWAPDGRHLLYVDGEHMWSVLFESTDRARIGTRRSLFPVQFPTAPDLLQEFVVGPDGRFLLLQEAAADMGATEVRVVMNWLDEVAAKVPAGR
jgi:Tol biopolymer transport system component